MKITKRNLLELFSVVLGGLLISFFIWFLYVGIYMTIETLFYSQDPLSFPADFLRLGASTIFMVVYILVFPKIKSSLFAATIAVAPISMFFIMIVLNLYTRYYIWIPILTLIMVFAVRELIKRKACWYFYLSLGYSLLLSLLYAWPD